MALDTIIEFLQRDLDYREAETRIIREKLAEIIKANGGTPPKKVRIRPAKGVAPKADKYVLPAEGAKQATLKPDKLRDQILTVIQANPGWAGAQIAESLGLIGKDAIRVYPRLEALRNRQMVRFDGHKPHVRYYPVEIANV